MKILLPVILTSAFQCSSAWAFEWFVDGDLSIGSDSNVSRSEFDSDRREDDFKTWNLSLTLEDQLSRQTGFSSNVRVSGQLFDTYTALDQTSVDFSIDYFFAPFHGFGSSTFQFGLAAGMSEFDSALRDRNHGSAAIIWSKRLTDRLSIRSGVRQTLEESDSEVFDIEKRDLFINFDLSNPNGWALQTSAILQNGDIVSSARPTHLKFIKAAEALIWDDAFGGQPADMIAYRLDATSLIFRFGANYALNQNNTLDFSFTTLQTEADENISYQRSISSFSFLHRF